MTGFSNISQMALAIRGRWKLALMVAVTVASSIMVIAAFLPPRYAATAWIVFNNRGSDAIVDKNDSLAFQAYVNGEVDLISSRRVLQHVAGDKALLRDPRTLAQRDRHQRGHAPISDWLVDHIARNLTVTSAKGTRTVAIATEFDDPDWAASVANLVARAYLDTAVDLKVTPARQNVAFFRAQKATRAAELASVQSTLEAFLRATGMTGLEANTDTDELQMRVLAERLGVARVEQAGTAARSGLGGVDTAISAGNINNVAVQQLRTSIAAQSAILRDLQVLSGPNYPAVVQARARLSELEGQLSAELGKVARGVDRNNVAVARESSQISAMEAQKRQVLTQTAGNRARLAELTGDVTRAKVNYDGVAARLADVELQSALEAPSAAVLSPATVPRGASFPNWLNITALALAAGATLGIIAALVKEMLVPRVRSRLDLEHLLGGAPVLCDLTA
ncbi:MAG: hypothetical protein H7147_06470 [Frankiaceae bacterium]|nr:hypothetical protein [Arenimonas sp.]